MKSWNYILIAALLMYTACVCISCIKAEEIESGPTGETTDEAYFSFQLNTHPAQAGTRTSTDDGTAEERKVSEVYMLLYESGGTTAKLLQKKLIQATNTAGTFVGNDVAIGNANTFVMKAVKIARKDYQAIILVNPSATILSNTTENVHTVADMLTVITATNANNYISANGFFMTNAAGVVQILKADIKDGAHAAQQAPVAIPVERNLAKVFLYENRNKELKEVTTGGTIEEVTWALDITNKQTYLLRMQDKLKGGTVSEIGFVANRSAVYAKDPNFTGNKTIIADEQQRANHFNILDPLATAGFQPWNGYQKPANYYSYVLENTLSGEEQNATDADPLTYMTHVVLKVIISNPGKAIAEADYYSFAYRDAQNKLQWRAFTHAQAVEWFNTTYPSDMPAALHQALEEAENQSGSPFKFKIENQLAPNAPDGYASTATSKGQITWHKGGLNIYRIPIMHFGVDVGVDSHDYGYYGVVRNNTYNIIINSINGPGTNTTDEGYLSANITVNPWFQRGWEEDLIPDTGD